MNKFCVKKSWRVLNKMHFCWNENITKWTLSLWARRPRLGLQLCATIVARLYIFEFLLSYDLNPGISGFGFNHSTIELNCRRSLRHHCLKTFQNLSFLFFKDFGSSQKSTCVVSRIPKIVGFINTCLLCIQNPNKTPHISYPSLTIFNKNWISREIYLCTIMQRCTRSEKSTHWVTDTRAIRLFRLSTWDTI